MTSLKFVLLDQNQRKKDTVLIKDYFFLKVFLKIDNISTYDYYYYI